MSARQKRNLGVVYADVNCSCGMGARLSRSDKGATVVQWEKNEGKLARGLRALFHQHTQIKLDAYAPGNAFVVY